VDDPVTQIREDIDTTLTPPCTTQLTIGFEVEFRALLTDGAQEEVRFERMAVGST
jgi:hypothetical protein